MRKIGQYVWKVEELQQEALKYNTITEFARKSSGAYASAIKRNLLKDICKHMTKLKNPSGYWTKELCQIEALKCETKKEFIKKYPGAYYAARRDKFLNDICKHMIQTGNKYKRCVYIATFKDKSVYIGITFNLNKRIDAHFKKGAIYNHINKTGLQPKIKQITDYIDIKLAQKIEIQKIKNYKKRGISVLNTTCGGDVGGGNLIYTYECCKEIAKKYIHRIDFRNEEPSAYSSACRNKWLKNICSHMIYKHNKLNNIK